MGNSQSSTTNGQCPPNSTSPLWCQALCLCKEAPELLNDDRDSEWFGELPRGKKPRKKRKKKSRISHESSDVKKMPSLPEVRARCVVDEG